MSNFIGRTALTITLIIVVTTIAVSGFGGKDIVYDCQNIRPEYPKDVQEECREIMLRHKVLVV